MRGKAVGKSLRCRLLRITPAYAGKSLRIDSRGILSEDHPRLCGEKLSNTVSSLLTLGSPPPMRGKAAPETRRGGTSRITPAYAGKSHKILCIINDNRDHPRLCGEKSIRFSGIAFAVGSPPPMRGKVSDQFLSVNFHRITPAYAGKRSGTDLHRIENKDHPRLCGEKITHFFLFVA